MHKLRHFRESNGLTISKLSELSDISVSVIYRIESGHNPFNVKDRTADALAEAMYLKRSDIFHVSEVSHFGRNPHTGKPIRRLRLVSDNEELCETCYVYFPREVGCDSCAA